MFRSLGLYKQVPCPKHHNCNLQNCIFGHEIPVQQDDEADKMEYDPFSAGEVVPPPSKKRKIESIDPEHGLKHHGSNDRKIIAGASQSLPARTIPVTGEKPTKDPLKKQSQTVVPINKAVVPIPPSMKRSVSPPPKRESKKVTQVSDEKLIPRPVPRAPALLKVRISLIEVLYKQMISLNSQSGPSDGENTLMLSDQEIIKWILDEEEKAAARLGNDIYRNAMSQKILQIKKTKPTDWQAFVNTTIKPAQVEQKALVNKIPTILSVDEQVHILKFLRTNLTGLDVHGYVTKAPTNLDIQKAMDAVRTSGGYEVCDRCSIRFQVFPGRDALGRLTTKGECHYHWSKLNRALWQKTDHITGQGQSSYPCCGRPTGSEGCTEAATHVFKVADPKRMAAVLQFEQTPSKNDEKKRGPVAFDCEMAYTTHGMEVVRITAVSWPQNTTLLDVFVRPFGEVLDLNTRFSGVTPEQFARAQPYTTTEDSRNPATESGEIATDSLRKVDSPAVARQLLFDLLTPETPLIGHAIENDLNTCRIIHSFVVDTALLYPHPLGLPRRYGLKMLTSVHLNRNIQTGGDAGHDSKEDSIATGDLVQLKVTEKWQMMRLQGWKFVDGVLVPPTR